MFFKKNFKNFLKVFVSVFEKFLFYAFLSEKLKNGMSYILLILLFLQDISRTLWARHEGGRFSRGSAKEFSAFTGYQIAGPESSAVFKELDKFN
ncbi:MAG: hypothetical protein DSY91_00495 [Deltaproteobacteria bacterium]|nr:MAG: hypothetical protein DSY91_00495 [Deltaproteobacteria bacterium]